MGIARRKIVAPRPHPETEAYWQAAAAGQLLLKQCRACAEFHYYPRAICPHCLSDATQWITSTGRGRLYSYSTMGAADAAYTLAYVTLDEGVTMLTNIVACDADDVQIGQAVTVVFQNTDNGAPVPMFKPA